MRFDTSHKQRQANRSYCASKRRARGAVFRATEQVSGVHQTRAQRASCSRQEFNGRDFRGSGRPTAVIYLDTTYLVRLYLADPGWEKVRELAGTDQIACSILGHAEVLGAFHRKLREGVVTANNLTTLIEEFERDVSEGSITWLPLSEAVIERLVTAFKIIPATTSLRSSDAVHLATAAENSFPVIYTNDRQLLSASAHFNIKAANII